MNQRFTIGAVIAVAVLALATLIAPLTYTPATAAPGALVTPLSVSHSGVRSNVMTFWEAEQITATGCSPLLSSVDHEKIDVQYVVQQVTTPTAITLTLRHSNDGSNLVAGDVVAATSSSAQNDMKQLRLYGRQTCVWLQNASTRPVNVTVIGVAK